MQSEEFSISTVHAGKRLRDVLPALLDRPISRKQLRGLIAARRLTINGKNVADTGTTVHNRDVIRLHDFYRHAARRFPANIPVLYEDSNLLVLNKPPGWITSGNTFRTIENTLSADEGMAAGSEEGRARAIHRLDAPTSGILLFAKSASALRWYHLMFRTRKVQKEYQALCVGYALHRGRCDLALDGKEATTHWSVVNRVPSVRFGYVSHIKLTPDTGRTHQIRRHMRLQGHPLVGDTLYNPSSRYPGKGLFLHASKMKINKMDGQVLEVVAPLPDKFSAFLNRERRQWDVLAN